MPERSIRFAGRQYESGRPVDVAVELGYHLGSRWTVEGGADVEEVYAFAWFHYPVLSLTWAH